MFRDKRKLVDHSFLGGIAHVLTLGLIGPNLLNLRSQGQWTVKFHLEHSCMSERKYTQSGEGSGKNSTLFLID